jgi:hypothetical protein
VLVWIPERSPGICRRLRGAADREEKAMEGGALAGMDWSVLALSVILIGCLLCAFYFMLRRNRKDLDDLEELLKDERDSDEP